MSQPLVSICLPNLNGRPFLEERLETILAQTFTDWELVVCDSYSDDGSWEFFQKFADDSRVRLHQVPREGMYAGWNECLRRARGEYAVFAPSDDTAQPQLLEQLLTPLLRLPEVSIAVCDYQTINETGQLIDMPLVNSPRLFLGGWMTRPCLRPRLTEFILHCCFNTIWVTMSAVLFRRSLLQKIGLFRTDRRSQADLEWTLRATLAGDVAFVPGRFATWRIHGKQITPQRGYDWSFLRTTLACFNSVLHDPNAALPPDWRNIPHWDRELTKVWQLEYLDSFHLDRRAARENPTQFLSNCLAALRLKPDLLLSQLIRGFAWRKDFSPDRIVRAQELIDLFRVPWPAPGSSMVMEPRSEPMRVIFCSKYIPKAGDGASAYLLAIMDYFRRAGITVEWICLNDSPSGGRTPWYLVGPRFRRLARLSVWRNIQIGRLCIRPLPLYDWLHSIAAVIVRFLYPRAKGTRSGEKNATPRSALPSAKAIHFAAMKLQANPPDALLANYIWTADVLDAASPETLRLIITHDVQHERTASFKGHKLDSQIETWDAKTEARLLEKAQVLLAIQEEEAVSLRKLAPACEVITVPFPVLPQECHTPQVAGRCLFVGSDQLHNVHGLYWFLGEVWPQILETVPQATLHVCGSICSVLSDPSSKFQNVRLLGRVKEVGPEYSAAEVCVVPSHVGSGLKIKLVEALSYGRACVTTRIGLQGLMELENKAVRLADTPELFAAAVIELLMHTEVRCDMERIGRAYVADRLSPQMICQPLADRIQRHAVSVQPARSRKEKALPSSGFHVKARANKLLALATRVGRLSYRLGRDLETGGLPDCGVPEPAGRFLFSMAQTMPENGEIVEIGSCFGRSTIYLAEGARRSDRGIVWAVDPHTGDIAWNLGHVSTYEVFLRNIRKFGVESRVKPLKMTSQEAAKTWNGTPIRILFIDGWHTYEAVIEDILLWFPHVLPGGLIVFDDYSNPEFPGVRRAVDEQIQKLPVERPLRVATSLVWTRKL